MRDKNALVKLRLKIRKANQAYFNSGESLLPDEEYDNLVERLRKIKPSDPLLRQVGASLPKSQGKAKVNLPYSMPSLPKIHIDRGTFDAWWDKNGRGDLTVSDKLDGVSALYFESHGEAKLYTRGNGSVGGDISHLIGHIKGLPELRKDEAFRGEIIMTKSMFARKYAGDFTTSRNLISGIVNAVKEVHPAAASSAFVVHECVKPRVSISRKAKQLKARGFVVVAHTVMSSPSKEQVVAYLNKRRDASRIEIDGLVVESNGSRVAVKGITETAVAEVKSVEWNASRYGLLKPIVIFKKPVTLAGAKIERATGHNAMYINDNKIGPGALVEVIRSGEVIPKLMGTTKPASAEGMKDAFPDGLLFTWKGVDIVTKDKGDNKVVIAKRLVHFLTAIGVDRIKLAQMKLLVEAGFETIPDLVKGRSTDFERAGVGAAMSSHLQNTLTKRMKLVDHATMTYASGCFDRSLGSVTLTAIVKSLGIKTLMDVKVRPAEIMKLLSEIEGVGPSRIKQFGDGITAYRKLIRKLRWRPSALSKKPTLKKAGITGKRFSFTGFRDKQLELSLEKFGGEHGSLTKATTYLVVPDKSFSSSKTVKARQTGVKVITRAKLKKTLG